MSREIEASFEEHLRDEEHGLDFDDDNKEDDGEQKDVDLFIQNQASESPFPKRVIRDDRGRYIRCGDSTSGTGRKKTKMDLSWRLKDAVFGGPSHFNVLRSFGGHVAFSSWSNPENFRAWIKCYERPGCLEQMNGIKLSDTVRCMTTNLDENLISAFIERWQPNTNNFHMPFGEISIMLHDVYHILGIRVDGRKVFFNGPVEEEDEEESSMRDDECLKTRNATFLAVDIDDVVPPIYKGGGLLTQKLRTVVESGNEHDCLRAYLMMQLGMATRAGARGVSGCLSLLQGWIYEHFPDFRPHRGDRALLEQHRQRLDGLRVEHVAWTPYGFRPNRECRTTLYSGLIRFLDITIPIHMITPAMDHCPANLPKSYRVDFGQCANDQWGFTGARVKLSERSRPRVMPFETVPRYKIWFERISHQYLYPLTHRVEFARVGPIWEEPEVA
ncbi:hypothetical protein RND81_04G087300 [Saponaria officinalis]|uniref:Aminotransferase-like plant mobile domain-containing protein n=1 Tax=Saponaria officinalis TaxID=3572 RepID=A0AAW1LJL8_SAPOF